MGLEALKAKLDKATASDLLEVEAYVSRLTQIKAVEVAFVRRTNETEACIKCGAVDLAKWGKSKAGTQRFRCRACKATFSATNKTPFYRLRKRHLWAKYLSLMGQHISLQRLRDDHGLRMSIPALHRWRHRFLSALVGNPDQPLAGMVEADEKFFRTSFKGSRGWKHRSAPQTRRARKRGGATGFRGLGEQQVPTLTAVDRSGGIYQERIADLKHATIVQAMSPWVEPDSIICSDGNDAYAKVAQAIGCEHIRAKSGNRSTGYGNTSGLSIGRIDAYHRDVENLINRRCMGVSTRYLMNYFGWSRCIAQHKPFGSDLMAEMLS